MWNGIYSIFWGNPEDWKILLDGTDQQKEDVLQASHRWVNVVGLNVLWSQLNPSDPENYPEFSPTDPTNPAYDWRLIDETLRIASKHNKLVLIRVISGLEKTFSPAWVWKRNDFKWIEYKHKASQQKTIPAVWEPAYQQRWGAFIQALGRRYNANPILHRVAITLHGYEMFYLRDKGRLAEAIAKMGFTAAKYRSAFKWNAETFIKAFPNKVLFKDLSKAMDFPSNEIDPLVSDPKERSSLKRLNNDLMRDLIDFGGPLPSRNLGRVFREPALFLQSDGLHGSGASTGYKDKELDHPTRKPHEVVIKDRLDAMLKAVKTNTIGFETLMPKHKGKFSELVDVAIAWPVKYVGLFTKDLRNPEYAADIERLAKALQSR